MLYTKTHKNFLRIRKLKSAGKLTRAPPRFFPIMPLRRSLHPYGSRLSLSPPSGGPCGAWMRVASAELKYCYNDTQNE